MTKRDDVEVRLARHLLSIAGAFSLVILQGCASDAEAAKSTSAGASAQGARSGPVYYFSDCQSGAAAGCVPGDNSNRGTEASPKRDISAVNVDSLPAGATLLFKRGGSFNHEMIRFLNTNVTTTAPLTLDAYGTGAAPIWRATSFNGIEFGFFPTSPVTGGYVLRNLKIDGLGTSQWGMWLRGNVRDVVLEGVEITGFKIGIHSQNNKTAINNGLTLRNVVVTRNAEMGMLGDADNLLIENSRFVENNFSGSNFNHGIYLGGKGRNGVIRNTQFIRNSTVNGKCMGGNLTVHGQWDGLLIENNTVVQDSAADSCYGIVVNGGYSSQEWFRNLVLRGNTVSNVGGCAICLGSTTNALIEGNKLINDNNSYMVGILIPSSTYDGNDETDSGAVLRDNTVCFKQPKAGSAPTRLGAGTAASESGTVYRTGTDASSGKCAR